MAMWLITGDSCGKPYMARRHVPWEATTWGFQERESLCMPVMSPGGQTQATARIPFNSVVLVSHTWAAPKDQRPAAVQMPSDKCPLPPSQSVCAQQALF